MSANEFEWIDVEPVETVYAYSRGELDALAETLDAVSDTKIYVGDDPHDGLASDVLYNLDDWQ